MKPNRIEREKNFHDIRFESEDPRKSVKKYYSVVQSTKRIYREHVISACRDKALLELGCGPSGSTHLWHRSGAKVTGIDISPEGIKKAVKTAEEKNLDIAYHAMNAERTEFPDNSFDLTVGMGIIHHLELHTCYKELARILKPGGSAIFMEPLGHNPLVNLYRYVTPSLRTEDEHPLLLQDIELAKNYFDEVTPEYYQLCSLAAFPFRKTDLFETVSSKLERFDQALFEIVPYLKRHAWVCILKLGSPRKTNDSSAEKSNGH
ncbi:MAG: class I SAM-dependent methyltransferase [Pseudomonadota bacterium]